MKVIKKLWGLLVDDNRLASILVLSLVVAWVLVSLHQPLIGAFVIMLGLVVSIWISVEHQLQLKLKK